jgi:hypothetical protein
MCPYCGRCSCTEWCLQSPNDSLSVLGRGLAHPSLGLLAFFSNKAAPPCAGFAGWVPVPRMGFYSETQPRRVIQSFLGPGPPGGLAHPLFSIPLNRDGCAPQTWRGSSRPVAPTLSCRDQSRIRFGVRSAHPAKTAQILSFKSMFFLSGAVQENLSLFRRLIPVRVGGTDASRRSRCGRGTYRR